MNNILSKFEDVKITNSMKIGEDDQKYCDLQFEFYKKVYEAYEAHYKNMQQLEKEQKENFLVKAKEFIQYQSDYIWKYDGLSVNKTGETIVCLNRAFVSNICNYFSNKYHLNIDSSVLKIEDYNEYYKKYFKFYSVDDILQSCVFPHLGGLSFYDKSIEEIKAKARIERYYNEWRKEWCYDVKGKTIKFRMNLDSIIPALYFYDGNETEIQSCYTHNKVEDYKSFDNGNTDIKFIKPEYAMDFATKYLGYVLEK